MVFSELLESALIFINSFFNSINLGFKLFFNDLPIIYGLRLGWWFILFAVFGLIVSRIGGEDD